MRNEVLVVACQIWVISCDAKTKEVQQVFGQQLSLGQVLIFGEKVVVGWVCPGSIK